MIVANAEQLGALLRQARKDQGMTQAQPATAVAVAHERTPVPARGGDRGAFGIRCSSVSASERIHHAHP